jgi:glycosyltransferase involved in cell wall biosynthesis
MSNPPYLISAVINTYNAAAYLNECLNSLSDLDDIVICDMHSTDATLEIAKAHGARIFMHEHMGMAEPARNFAVAQAKHAWVLVVDADEIIPARLLQELHALTQQATSADAYRLPRKNLFFGKWMTHTYPDYQTRFFKAGHLHWENKVHTHPIVKGQLGTLEGLPHEAAMLHYSYTSVDDFVEKMNRYTRFEVEKRSTQKPFTLGRTLLKGVNAFYKTWFKQGAKHDGTHGLVVALLMAIYAMLVELKSWDAQRPTTT